MYYDAVFIFHEEYIHVLIHAYFSVWQRKPYQEHRSPIVQGTNQFPIHRYVSAWSCPFCAAIFPHYFQVNCAPKHAYTSKGEYLIACLPVCMPVFPFPTETRSAANTCSGMIYLFSSCLVCLSVCLPVLSVSLSSPCRREPICDELLRL